MKEIKIQIPDNCELVKDGDSYVIKEMKQNPPRSWEEFCKMYRETQGEYYIGDESDIMRVTFGTRHGIANKNLCTSEEEAEAFLALMQLRQLRKAWVGDWEPIKGETYWGIFNNIAAGICTNPFAMSNTAMSFPTPEMAEDFLSCFSDLCETAKILL